MTVLASNVGIKDAPKLRVSAGSGGGVRAMTSFRERAFAVREDLKSKEVQEQIAADQTKFTEGAFWPSISVSGIYAGADQHPSTSESEPGEYLRRGSPKLSLLRGRDGRPRFLRRRPVNAGCLSSMRIRRKGSRLRCRPPTWIWSPEGDTPVLERSARLRPRQLPCRGKAVRFRSVEQLGCAGRQHPPRATERKAVSALLQLPSSPFSG